MKSLGIFFCSRCERLQTLTLPREIESLPKYGISECVHLRSFGIPTKTTFIDKTFAIGCKRLREIDMLVYNGDAYGHIDSKIVKQMRSGELTSDLTKDKDGNVILDKQPNDIVGRSL